MTVHIVPFPENNPLRSMYAAIYMVSCRVSPRIVPHPRHAETSSYPFLSIAYSHEGLFPASIIRFNHGGYDFFPYL